MDLQAFKAADAEAAIVGAMIFSPTTSRFHVDEVTERLRDTQREAHVMAKTDSVTNAEMMELAGKISKLNFELHNARRVAQANIDTGLDFVAAHRTLHKVLHGTDDEQEEEGQMAGVAGDGSYTANPAVSALDYASSRSQAVSAAKEAKREENESRGGCFGRDDDVTEDEQKSGSPASAATPTSEVKVQTPRRSVPEGWSAKALEKMEVRAAEKTAEKKAHQTERDVAAAQAAYTRVHSLLTTQALGTTRKQNALNRRHASVKALAAATPRGDRDELQKLEKVLRKAEQDVELAAKMSVVNARLVEERAEMSRLIEKAHEAAGEDARDAALAAQAERDELDTTVAVNEMVLKQAVEAEQMHKKAFTISKLARKSHTAQRTHIAAEEALEIKRKASIATAGAEAVAASTALAQDAHHRAVETQADAAKELEILQTPRDGEEVDADAIAEATSAALAAAAETYKAELEKEANAVAARDKAEADRLAQLAADAAELAAAKHLDAKRGVDAFVAKEMKSPRPSTAAIDAKVEELDDTEARLKAAQDAQRLKDEEAAAAAKAAAAMATVTIDAEEGRQEVKAKRESVAVAKRQSVAVAKDGKADVKVLEKHKSDVITAESDLIMAEASAKAAVELAQASSVVTTAMGAIKDEQALARAALEEVKESGDAESIAAATETVEMAEALAQTITDTRQFQTIAVELHTSAKEARVKAKELRVTAETSGAEVDVKVAEKAEVAAATAMKDAEEQTAKAVVAAASLDIMIKEQKASRLKLADARANLDAAKDEAAAELAEAMKTTANLAVDLDFESTMQKKDAFVEGFEADMASSLGIPADKVQIENLVAGSVKVDFALTNGPDGAGALDSFVQGGEMPAFSNLSKGLGVEVKAKGGFTVTKRSDPAAVDAANAKLANINAQLDQIGEEQQQRKKELITRRNTAQAAAVELVAEQEAAVRRVQTRRQLEEAVSRGDEEEVAVADRAVHRVEEEDAFTTMVKATKRLAAVEEQQLNYLEERVRSLEETKNADKTVVDKAKKDLRAASEDLRLAKSLAKVNEDALQRRAKALGKQEKAEAALKVAQAAVAAMDHQDVISEKDSREAVNAIKKAQLVLSSAETDAEVAHNVAVAACIAANNMVQAKQATTKLVAKILDAEARGDQVAMDNLRVQLTSQNAVMTTKAKVADTNQMLWNWTKKAESKLRRAERELVKHGAATVGRENDPEVHAEEEALIGKVAGAKHNVARLQRVLLLNAAAIEEQNEVQAAVAEAKAALEQARAGGAFSGATAIEAAENVLVENEEALSRANRVMEGRADALVMSAFANIELNKALKSKNEGRIAEVQSSWDKCVDRMLEQDRPAEDAIVEEVQALAEAMGSSGGKTPRMVRNRPAFIQTGGKEVRLRDSVMAIKDGQQILQGRLYKRSRNGISAALGRWQPRWFLIANDYLQ